MLANVGPPGEIHEEAGNLWNYMHDMHYTSNVQCTCLCFKTSTNILDVCKHVCIFGAKKIQALLFHELHPSKGGWDWIKSEERCSKDKKVYSQLGLSIRDCYPSRIIQKMHHHLWHEGSLSASGSKQNGLIMCKMGDHVHSTIIVSANITSYLLNSSFLAPSKSTYCMSQDSLYSWAWIWWFQWIINGVGMIRTIAIASMNIPIPWSPNPAPVEVQLCHFEFWPSSKSATGCQERNTAKFVAGAKLSHGRD